MIHITYLAYSECSEMSTMVIIVRIPGAQQMLRVVSEFFRNSLEGAVVSSQLGCRGERVTSITYKLIQGLPPLFY